MNVCDRRGPQCGEQLHLVVNTLRDIRTSINYQGKMLEDLVRNTQNQALYVRDLQENNRLLKQLILTLNPEANVTVVEEPVQTHSVFRDGHPRNYEEEDFHRYEKDSE